VQIARKYHVLPVALVLDLPESVCLERNRARPNRQFGAHVVRGHVRLLRQGLHKIEKEGFRHVAVLRSPEEVAAANVTRVRVWNNLRHLHGPFDIIGDVHGCAAELRLLLERLGYTLEGDVVIPPTGRTAVFLGDLVDRGPDTPAVLRLVMSMVSSGAALCVPGNHDSKLARALKGNKVNATHGLEQSLMQLERETPEFKQEVLEFLDDLVSHYVLDDGKLVVVHAGMKSEYIGRTSREVREFALYGDTTGEADDQGLPVRLDWAAQYRGKALIVYGHTPTLEPRWVNNTMCLDTGCVFGGKLTALRYPERELISVGALETYAETKRFSSVPTQHQLDDVLDMADVLGKRVIETSLHGRVTIREENAMAALEVMSRFAVNPKWLVYLPSTMSPVETSSHPDYLERPEEAFAFYASRGVQRVMLEEKHMGSRAVVVLCCNEATARERFGVEGELGIVYTRTGRRFFSDANLERGLLEILRNALNQSELWARLETNWVVLDCELMPWSAKAQELLQTQYAPVGAAAQNALGAAINALQKHPALLEQFRTRAETVDQYRDAYARYCWDVSSLEDYKLAPFHILATENAVHHTKDHAWHMAKIQRFCEADSSGVLRVTAHRVVNLEIEAERLEAIQWWESITASGSEGMVVKPLEFTVKGSKGMIQPALKVRGLEYLRIIYGPEYTLPVNLERLKARGLSAKRSLALREYALGIESLERFVKREPLRRTHEAVFGVLALESEPIDPRL
jgi:protein phosphatase